MKFMVTNPVKRAIVLINLLGGLAGCTVFSPRYQITHRYEPPTDPAGIACLEKCTQKLEMCQQSCQSTYQACLKRIEPLAEERYRKAVERYDEELDTYRRRMQFGYSGWGRATLGWGMGGVSMGLGWLPLGVGFALGLGRRALLWPGLLVSFFLPAGSPEAESHAGI